MSKAAPRTSRATQTRPSRRGIRRLEPRVFFTEPVTTTQHRRVAITSAAAQRSPSPPNGRITTTLVDIPLSRPRDTAITVAIGKTSVRVAKPPAPLTAITGTTEAFVATETALRKVQARPRTKTRSITPFPLTSRLPPLEQAAVRRSGASATQVAGRLTPTTPCSTTRGAATRRFLAASATGLAGRRAAYLHPKNTTRERLRGSQVAKDRISRDPNHCHSFPVAAK